MAGHGARAHHRRTQGAAKNGRATGRAARRGTHRGRAHVEVRANGETRARTPALALAKRARSRPSRRTVQLGRPRRTETGQAHDVNAMPDGETKPTLCRSPHADVVIRRLKGRRIARRARFFCVPQVDPARAVGQGRREMWSASQQGPRSPCSRSAFGVSLGEANVVSVAGSMPVPRSWPSTSATGRSSRRRGAPPGRNLAPSSGPAVVVFRPPA